METKTGLPKNTAAALAYVLGAVTGIIFLLLETNSYVRFHALQATVFSLIIWILAQFFGLVRFLAFLTSLSLLVWFGVTLFLIIRAHQGEEYELPWVGKFVRNLLGRV